ncbi:MAG: RHS repeat-associated core domain-containing protein, partial [Chthoniobacterales bacterium]
TATATPMAKVDTPSMTQTNCYCYPSNSVSANISTTTPNAQICWTNDGTDPTAGNPSTHIITSSSGPAYGNSYESVTFRAVAYRADMFDSDEDDETFYYDAESGGNMAQSMGASVQNASSYDANGNLTGYKGWTYTYDAQNRLTFADNHSGTRVHYYYDGLNRRIASSDINGNVTINVWDGWNLIEERTSGNGLICLYVDGAGTDEKVLRWSPNTGRFWYHQDGRGNVSHLSHDSGILLERYTYDFSGNAKVYDSNGNIRPGGSAYSNRFLFQGRDYSSELGLYDYRNRTYFPQWGRFLQTDPIGFRGDSSNLYRYCGNNGISGADPSGLGHSSKPDPQKRVDGNTGNGGEATTDRQVVSGAPVDFDRGPHGETQVTDRNGGLGFLNQGGGRNSSDGGGGYSVTWSKDSNQLGRSGAVSPGSATQGWWTSPNGFPTGSPWVATIAVRTIINGAIEHSVKSFQSVTINVLGEIVAQTNYIGATYDAAGHAFQGNGYLQAWTETTLPLINVFMQGHVWSAWLPEATAIDYRFRISSDLLSNSATLTGMHDAYPSYSVTLNGHSFYDFQETYITTLLPPMDVSVNVESGL